MGMRLYVGNIPWTADEAALRERFATVGSVREVKIVTDRESGQPRGFAFVEMSTSAEADAAVAQLDGQDLGGRPMKVSEAQPRPPRTGGYGGGARTGGGGGGGGGGGYDGGGGGGDRGRRGGGDRGGRRGDW